jgi:hypothetical protein
MLNSTAPTWSISSVTALPSSTEASASIANTSWSGRLKRTTLLWSLPFTSRQVVGPTCSSITATCGAGRPLTVGSGAGVGMFPVVTAVVWFPEWKTAA